MRKRVVVLVIVLTSFALLFAEGGLSTTSLTLKGSVLPNSILDIAQLIGGAPEDAIPLDSGDILTEVGVEVGQWSVFSNSSATLSLYIEYDSFTNENYPDTSIEYEVSNGTNWISSGSLYKNLVKVDSVYRIEDNNGPVIIRRTDTNPYPPSNNYKTTISLSLVSQ